MGVAEVVLEDVKEMAPATQPIMDGQLTAVGVNITDRTVVSLRPVLPQNFLIDPVATSVENALGVAVDEFVSRHTVEQLQEEGVYRDVYVGNAAPDYDIEPDQDLTSYDEDKVRLTKYYGLVPRDLLNKTEREEMIDEDEDIFVHHTSIKVGGDPYKFLKKGEYVNLSLESTESDEHKYQGVNIRGVLEGKLMCEVLNENTS